MASTSVNLFRHESEEIRITIDAYFENQTLVIDGYDIGKRVEEYWGDSDYEYVVRIPEDSVQFLFDFFNISPGDEQALLNALANRFNTNTCYSDIRSLLDANGIKYEGFTWA